MCDRTTALPVHVAPLRPSSFFSLPPPSEMMPKKATLDLFYDVSSPYTWIAFEALLRYETIWPIELRLLAFQLSAVMKASGNRPPMMVAAKGILMATDMERNNRYWGLNIKIPSNPFESVVGKSSAPVMRFLASISLHEPKFLVPAARAAWQRIWSDDLPCDNSEHFLQIAKKIGLPNGEKFAENWNNAEAKELIAKNTQEAIDHGAFGAPWILLRRPGQEDVEAIFGSDRFHIIADMLDAPFPGPLKELASKL